MSRGFEHWGGGKVIFTNEPKFTNEPISHHPPSPPPPDTTRPIQQKGNGRAKKSLQEFRDFGFTRLTIEQPTVGILFFMRACVIGTDARAV